MCVPRKQPSEARIGDSLLSRLTSAASSCWDRITEARQRRSFPIRVAQPPRPGFETENGRICVSRPGAGRSRPSWIASRFFSDFLPGHDDVNDAASPCARSSAAQKIAVVL
ncbi:hypothetical protein MRX96_032203 [Rhipicephalus microplus]